MSDISVQLRITSVRSRGDRGGAIFSGVTEDGDNFVAVCNYRLVPDSSLPDKGQMWAVTGSPSVREIYAANGFKIRETQICAVAASLVRPTGRNIIGWIAQNPDILGIGHVRARKLYDRFGPELIDLIERKDFSALTQIISQKAAELLCQAFEKHAVATTLSWLDQLAMPRRIGAGILAYYKDEAQEKVEANP